MAGVSYEEKTPRIHECGPNDKRMLRFFSSLLRMTEHS